MPSLTRGQRVGPLLKTVGGKPTGESAPGEGQHREEQDIEGSPVSSDNEQEEPELEVVDVSKKSETAHKKEQRQDRGEERGGSRRQPARVRSQFKDEYPPTNTSTRLGSKRKSEEMLERLAKDEEETLLESWGSQSQSHSQSQKRFKSSQTYGGRKHTFQQPKNIYAEESPRKQTFRRPDSISRSPPRPQETSTNSFKSPRDRLSALNEREGHTKSNRTFKAPRAPPRADVEDGDAPDSSAYDSTNADSHTFNHDHDLDAFSDASSRLSTPPPEAELEEEALAFDAAEIGTDKDLARCPMCHKTIDRESLDLFTNGERLHWKDKIKFCESHKRRDAETLWTQRGYPDIDWDNFERRIAAQYNHRLSSLLQDEKHSKYWQRLSDKVQSGRVRKAFRDVRKTKQETVTPGYYGPKGAHLAHEYILKVFDLPLSGKVKEDAVVRAAGVSNFVQSVLVPELALMLVKDDMRLDWDDDERAEEILKESAAIGELLNAYEEDKIKQEPGVDLEVLTQAA